MNCPHEEVKSKCVVSYIFLIVLFLCLFGLVDFKIDFNVILKQPNKLSFAALLFALLFLSNHPNQISLNFLRTILFFLLVAMLSTSHLVLLYTSFDYFFKFNGSFSFLKINSIAHVMSLKFFPNTSTERPYLTKIFDSATTPNILDCTRD